MRLLLALLCLTLAGAPGSHAADAGFIKPSPRDRCPVCGMFVAPYPEWTAEIVFKDSSYAVFDGPRDMFRYYRDLARYKPGKTGDDILAVYVTEYYTLSPLDGRAAFYVWNSDIPGPMGREFIPFRNEADAGIFKKDHRGESIIRFGGGLEKAGGAGD